MSQLKGPSPRPAAPASPAPSPAAPGAAPGSIAEQRRGPDTFGRSGGAAQRPVGSEPGPSGADADPFDPSLDASGIEQLGNLKGAIHLCRLMHRHATSGRTSDEAAMEAAKILGSFSRGEAARAVLRELELLPIHTAFPLQVQLALMQVAPSYVPDVRRGELVTNRGVLGPTGRVLAGHATRVEVDPRVKIDGVALLGGGEPGFEFEPLRRGTFRLLVDTPGTWTFAVRGSMADRHLVDTFTVDVKAPGRRAAS